MHGIDQLDAGTAEALLAGGALIGVGWVLGRFARLRRRPKPFCDCGHAFGAHDPATGHCGAAWKGSLEGKQRMFNCACRVYTGPEPALSGWALERMYAQVEAHRDTS